MTARTVGMQKQQALKKLYSVFLYMDSSSSWKMTLLDASPLLWLPPCPRVWLRAVIGHWLYFSVARVQCSHESEINATGNYTSDQSRHVKKQSHADCFSDQSTWKQVSFSVWNVFSRSLMKSNTVCVLCLT